MARKYIEFGSYFKNLRKKSGLSQFALSQVLGYTNCQFISNIERGISLLPASKIALTAKAFDVDAFELANEVITHHNQRFFDSIDLGKGA